MRPDVRRRSVPRATFLDSGRALALCRPSSLHRATRTLTHNGPQLRCADLRVAAPGDARGGGEDQQSADRPHYASWPCPVTGVRGGLPVPSQRAHHDDRPTLYARASPGFSRPGIYARPAHDSAPRIGMADCVWIFDGIPDEYFLRCHRLLHFDEQAGAADTAAAATHRPACASATARRRAAVDAAGRCRRRCLKRCGAAACTSRMKNSSELMPVARSAATGGVATSRWWAPH